MTLRQFIMRAAMAGVAITLTASAHADVDLEETHTSPFGFPLSPGSATLPVPQFDDQGGARILNRVTLTVDGEISAAVTAENDATIPAPDFLLSLTGLMSADFGGLSAVLAFSGVFPTDGTVEASDGVPDSGPDFWDFGVVTVADGDSVFTESGLAPFIGASTLDATVPASGGFALDGSTDATMTVNDFFGADGLVTVVYAYTLVGGGACCFADGSCVEATVTDCAIQGGAFQGQGTVCVPDLCPPVKGACCLLDGSCFALPPDACAVMGGAFQGDLTVCSPGFCPDPTGACCFPDGSCTEETQDDCLNLGGLYQGDNTSCAPGLCVPLGQGACCFNDGSCVDATDADCAGQGGSFMGAGTTCAGIICPTSGPRVSSTDKGSLLIFSKVEIKWQGDGQQPPAMPATLVQDTFISLTNDFPKDVLVQMYFINGDPPLDAVFNEKLNPPKLLERSHTGWNFVDNLILLTANEPTYWSALTGLPKGVSPFTVLDPGGLASPGRPCEECGPGMRCLRGYIIAWAVDQENRQIRWNHLKGEGTLVNYTNDYAWEYNSWNHTAVAGANGDLVGTAGTLRLDGVEYSPSFDELLFNFQAAGSDGFTAPAGTVNGNIISDTDLTLHPPSADLRQNNDGPVTTKASMDIWNENEVKFSGTHRCITCWDQTLISRYDTPNHFLYPFLQTNHGKARIDGHAADVCNVLDDPDTPEDESVTSVASPLLGVHARLLTSAGGFAASGSNLFGMGIDKSAVILYDVSGVPPEAVEPVPPRTRRGFGRRR